jgi:hypothetical protein
LIARRYLKSYQSTAALKAQGKDWLLGHQLPIGQYRRIASRWSRSLFPDLLARLRARGLVILLAFDLPGAFRRTAAPSN